MNQLILIDKWTIFMYSPLARVLPFDMITEISEVYFEPYRLKLFTDNIQNSMQHLTVQNLSLVTGITTDKKIKYHDLLLHIINIFKKTVKNKYLNILIDYLNRYIKVKFNSDNLFIHILTLLKINNNDKAAIKLIKSVYNENTGIELSNNKYILSSDDLIHDDEILSVDMIGSNINFSYEDTIDYYNHLL